MREIQLEELQQIELNLLVKVDAICKAHGWDYSLCGGTLLGAIRHKGFIPWDDDIDIAMPREDYNKFLNYCISNEKECGVRIVSAVNDKRYACLFTKVCDSNTVVTEEDIVERYGVEIGVWVDIFPVDGLGGGGTKAEARKRFNATRFERELLAVKNWKRFFRSRTHGVYIEPIRFAFWIMSRFASAPKLVEKVEAYYAQFSLAESNYAAIVCGGCYREKEILPTEVFTTLTEVEFEGKQFMAFERYDEYLRSIYGDYMKLPPEDKRTSHHMFQAYWKE